MPPYHPDYELEDDTDEVPLAELHTRSVRIRRGSEGFMIRPRVLEESDEDSEMEQESDWEELFEKKRTALYDSDSDNY